MNNLQEINDLLLTETSRRNTDLVAGLVFQKPGLFEELFRVFMSNEEPASRRSAWVIDTVSEKLPELLVPHIPEMIRMLPFFNHDALKRHSLRMLTRSPLPEGELSGILVNCCFEWLMSRPESVSVKVYSMEILYRVSEIEPDLKKELADSIELHLDEETTGVQNRGRKLLKKLYSEMNDLKKP